VESSKGDPLSGDHEERLAAGVPGGLLSGDPCAYPGAVVSELVDLVYVLEAISVRLRRVVEALRS
jgi:hypothetical protein